MHVFSQAVADYTNFSLVGTSCLETQPTPEDLECGTTAAFFHQFLTFSRKTSLIHESFN